MANHSLKEMWAAYLELAVPPESTPERVEEARCTFYSGASAFATILEGVVDCDNAERATQMLNNAQAELNEFFSKQYESEEGGAHENIPSQ